MIASGAKRIEYRRDCPHWRSRVKDNPTVAQFRNYTGSARVLVEITQIQFDCPGRTEWGSDPGQTYIGIHLGKVLEVLP